jgi:hypothetical protein
VRRTPVDYFVRRCITTTEDICLGNPDRITHKLEHIFSNGQCHALAAALHEILGWPILGCYHQFDNLDKRTNHFVVEVPNHPPCTADIHGIRCVDYGLRPASYKRIVTGKLDNFLKPNMELARHFAPLIASEIQNQCRAMDCGRKKPRWTICSEGYA